MQTEFITLKETILTNNCPECYAQESLQLVFKQERAFSKFLTTTRKGVISTMHCNKCDTEIYPGMWTDDIERVYDYHKKTVEPKPASFRFTSIFYVMLFALLLIVAIGLTYYYKPDLFKV